MKMLRWSLRVPRMDELITERKAKGGSGIKGKMMESRFRWYGYILRAQSTCVASMVFGEGLEGNRKGWMDTLKSESAAFSGERPKEMETAIQEKKILALYLADLL